MDSHGARSESAAAQRVRKSDIEATAEKYARLRKGLPKRLLAPHCLPAVERLFDYTHELVAERTPSHDGLEEAAREVLYWSHATLRELEGSEPLTDGVGSALVFGLADARSALNEIYGRSSVVKAIEVELSEGQPRAVCWGTTFKLTTDDVGRNQLPWFVAERIGGSSVSSWAPGCMRVFRDTTQTERHQWRTWCDEHKPSRAHVAQQWKSEIRKRWEEHALRFG